MVLCGVWGIFLFAYLIVLTRADQFFNSTTLTNSRNPSFPAELQPLPPSTLAATRATRRIRAVDIVLKYDASKDGTHELIFSSYNVAYESRTRGTRDTYVRDCQGQPLVKVTHQFAEDLLRQGSGRLLTGQYMNIGDCLCENNFSCFMFTAAAMGIGGAQLQAFVSVSSDVYPLGTYLMVEELKGLLLPNGEHHDGCVRVDDYYEDSILGNLTLFVDKKGNDDFIRGLLHNDNVRATPSDCKPKHYTDRYLFPISMVLFKFT
ncbi:hypothetical protein H4R33_002875 [Dimargaris cristalligena]|nr:hypothetical protein H4R33_002875 [Dimargaris cristalligena]